MSVNKLISIRNPIMDAMTMLNLDHDKDEAIFTAWATDAEKQIGSFNQYERLRAVLDITGCSACLPVDCVMVEIAIMGNLGAGCENLFAAVCSNDDIAVRITQGGETNFLVVDVGDPANPVYPYGYVNYNIQNNKIIFDYDYTDRQVTVQYLRYKTDCNGFMEVGKNHVNAIKWFLVYQYLSRRMLGKSRDYIDRNMFNHAYQEWNRECANARAEDNRPTFSDRQKIAKMYSDPFSGRGLWQGMYTTLGNNYYIW